MENVQVVETEVKKPLTVADVMETLRKLEKKRERALNNLTELEDEIATTKSVLKDML